MPIVAGETQNPGKRQHIQNYGESNEIIWEAIAAAFLRGTPAAPVHGGPDALRGRLVPDPAQHVAAVRQVVPPQFAYRCAPPFSDRAGHEAVEAVMLRKALLQHRLSTCSEVRGGGRSRARTADLLLVRQAL